MIAELDRYQGVVLRQMLAASNRRVTMGVAGRSGRIDAFSIDGAAFQIKHSSKRLSPWQFTFLPENLAELAELREQFDPVWVMLVCGVDGIVGISVRELDSIVGLIGASGVRVSRSRNAMYRVSGPGGELARAKPRGVTAFLAEIHRTSDKRPSE